jgi:triacylglycerol lipase
MSFLVEIPQSAYPDDALARFSVKSDFDLENARAMMWMSQLAYETRWKDKIDKVLATWGLTELEVIDNEPGTAISRRTACAIVACGHGATIVAFAGTDPLKINDWITDFTPQPSTDDIHTGFQSAVDKIWQRITNAIKSAPATERALFFTGHSLGGALAIIAAQRAPSDPGIPAATAVYTFGSPRAGGPQFAGAYPMTLADSTYRLVHGNDLVATVPPSRLPPPAAFQHVGRCIQCKSGGRFDLSSPILPRGEDKPDFLESAKMGALDELRTLLAGQLFRQVGPGVVGWIVAVLPRQARDHVPASYFAALAR